MKITPITLASLAGVSAIISFQDSASARSRTYSIILDPNECNVVAEREGESSQSAVCSTSRQESFRDFDLPELVRLVEFSNKRGQKTNLSSVSKKLSKPRPEKIMVAVERIREI